MKRVFFPVLARFPREIEWINWDTVTAQARAGIKGHEAEWLGPGGIDHFPNVDPHRAVDQFQFVNQCDIHAPEYILQQLGRLCDATGGHRH